MRLKGHARKGEKSQIALEFIIVYSFVLVIFLVIFALIAAQRASTLSAQQFSSLELITQNIATNIDHALAAGSGYTATIPIVGSISALPYNLYISSTGVVLANMTIGKQVISAEAYSSARSISVNATFQGQTANDISVYSIPVYTGTMRISNSRGTIYIDQKPVSTVGLPVSTELQSSNSGNNAFTTSLKVADFNGNSEAVVKGVNLGSNIMQTGITITFWVNYHTEPSGCPSTPIVAVRNQSGFPWVGIIAGCPSSAPTNPYAFICTYNTGGVCGGGGHSAPGPSTLSYNKWYMLAATYNPSLTSNNFCTYVDNESACNTQTGPFNATRIANMLINFDWSFNYSIANVQIYNISLTPQEIYAIYNEGISSKPTNTQNLVSWYPLDGNMQDYSGNGNALTPINPNNISYSDVAQIAVKEFLGTGKPANNALIGMVTSHGNFVNGPVSSTHADSNGTSIAYISSNTSYGLTNVTINGFNGNLSTAGNLVAWFPLNLGYGNTTYSMVNNLTGTFVNPSWAPMPGNSSSIYAGAFDGSNSIVNTTFSVPHAASGITISAWVDNNGKGTYEQNIAEISGEPYTHETLDIGVAGSGGNAVIRWSNYANTFADQPAGGTIAPNTWYLVTGVWSGFNNTLSIYVNGKLVATGNGNDTGLTSIREINIGESYPGMYNFNGSIANVQVYNSSLSPAQVQSIYAEGMTGTPIGSAGLQAWYPLDGNAQDYSIYDHATSSSNMSFVSQGLNATVNSNYKVASFNGQTGSSYIVTPVLTGLNGASGASFNACFYLDSLLNNEILISDDWSSSQIMQIYIHTNGQLEADYGNGGWFSVALTPQNTIKVNKRYCITTTYASGGGQEIYVNGVAQPLTYSVGSATSTGTLASGTTGDIAYNQGNGGAFAGQIANIQIYNTTLTPTQAKQLYMQGLPFYKKLNVSV